MDDLISKKAAIDYFVINVGFHDEDGYPIEDTDELRKIWTEYFDGIPPAEPKIIYCKDCKHFIREDKEEYTPYGFYNTYFDAFCDKHWDNEQGEYINVKLDDFCSFAERKEQDG